MSKKSDNNRNSWLWKIGIIFGLTFLTYQLGDDVYRHRALQDLNEEGKKRYEIDHDTELEPTDFKDENTYYKTIAFEENWEEHGEELPEIQIGNVNLGNWWYTWIFSNSFDPIKPFSERGNDEVTFGPTKTVEVELMSVIEETIKEENIRLSWYLDAKVIYDDIKVETYSDKIGWMEAVKDRKFIRILLEYAYKAHYGTTEKINIGTSIEPVINDDGTVDITVVNQYFLGENGSFEVIPEQGELTKKQLGMIFSSDPVDTPEEMEESRKTSKIFGNSINIDSADASKKYFEEHQSEYDNMLNKIQQANRGRDLQNACALEALRLKSQNLNDAERTEIMQALAQEYPEQFSSPEDVKGLNVHYIMELYQGKHQKSPTGKCITINTDDLPDPKNIETDKDRKKYIENLIESGVIPMPNGYKKGNIVQGDIFNSLADKKLETDAFDAGYSKGTTYISYGEEIQETNEPLTTKKDRTEEGR